MGIKKGVAAMANAKIIEQKAAVVSEIKEKFDNAKSIVLFDARGLKVSEVNELRRTLRETDSDYKVYKNTLTKRAVEETGYDLNSYLIGPTAISFSSDELAPVKVLSDFAKKHENLKLKAGVVEGRIKFICFNSIKRRITYNVSRWNDRCCKRLINMLRFIF